MLENDICVKVVWCDSEFLSTTAIFNIGTANTFAVGFQFSIFFNTLQLTF